MKPKFARTCRSSQEDSVSRNDFASGGCRLREHEGSADVCAVFLCDCRTAMAQYCVVLCCGYEFYQALLPDSTEILPFNAAAMERNGKRKPMTDPHRPT